MSGLVTGIESKVFGLPRVNDDPSTVGSSIEHWDSDFYFTFQEMILIYIFMTGKIKIPLMSLDVSLIDLNNIKNIKILKF